jgi:hypothetical protein
MFIGNITVYAAYCANDVEREKDVSKNLEKDSFASFISLFAHSFTFQVYLLRMSLVLFYTIITQLAAFVLSSPNTDSSKYQTGNHGLPGLAYTWRQLERRSF